MKITKQNVSTKVVQFNLENLTHNRASITGIGWFMQRFIYMPKYDRWSYCAGQDYDNEIASIRRKLSTM